MLISFFFFLLMYHIATHNTVGIWITDSPIITIRVNHQKMCTAKAGLSKKIEIRDRTIDKVNWRRLRIIHPTKFRPLQGNGMAAISKISDKTFQEFLDIFEGNCFWSDRGIPVISITFRKYSSNYNFFAWLKDWKVV